MAKPTNTLNLPIKAATAGPVECLGQTFTNDEARRAHFTDVLRAKLKDPEFRKTPGFPKGADEDILAMSDPPYYTACPNPFLADLVRSFGKPHVPGEAYHRDPLATDTSVGKSDAVYKAHGYHTKVPHLAIVPAILHYTEPGDVVLDGFCGSGMTGVAAQFCGTAPPEYRAELEAQWKKEGRAKPKWGGRKAVLNDLGPAATFIAANYNLPFDVDGFGKEAQRILNEVEAELGWMYETTHSDGSKARINFTVWSEVFTCGECAGEVVYVEEALDLESKRVADSFPCPHCRAELTKQKMDRIYLSRFDPAVGENIRTPKRKPVLVNYDAGGETHERPPTAEDAAVVDRALSLPLPASVPHSKLPYMHMTHERARMDAMGITHLHHFFLPRAAHTLALLWAKARAVRDGRLRSMLIWFVEQAVWGMSVLARYAPTHFSQVNQYLSGVYYVGSQIVDVSPQYILNGKLKRLTATFEKLRPQAGTNLTTGTCASLPLPASCIDYIFTDPPFGENIYYSDLNFLVESWHKVVTDAGPEAIIDKAKDKELNDYQDLMRACFVEYGRVLKPGRWMTVVFSNSSNAVWRSIQEALGTAGFVVADVRTLDKQQGSYRQVTSSAMKQDLVISAYKPSEALSRRFELTSGSAEDAWAFTREHLQHVPVFADVEGEIEVVAERTPQVLHDRMIAFFVQRGVSVPLASAEFFAGLETRYAKRDGMYFLADQVTVYDRKRALGGNVRQLQLFVQDEASAIRWVRQLLDHKPTSFQDLNPIYMKTVSAWSKHERTVELRDILRENFLHYDGVGAVPNPIHSYLSSNMKLRNLDKSNPELRAAAHDRWYVPSVHSQADIDKLRSRALLREFEEYKQSSQKKIKLFRAEAVRAGFKAAYDARDWRTIVDVAAKLPDIVLQEDEKLAMYLDVAAMRVESSESPKLF